MLLMTPKQMREQKYTWSYTGNLFPKNVEYMLRDGIKEIQAITSA
jgi:hypothetical protein